MAATDSESWKTTIMAYTRIMMSAGTDTRFSIFIQLMPTTAVMHITRPHRIVETIPEMGTPIMLRMAAKASPHMTAWKPNQQI